MDGDTVAPTPDAIPAAGSDPASLNDRSSPLLPASPLPGHGSAWEVFGVALKLGLTSFGGPIAHLGYFREEYVNRRKWLDEQTYADLVGLCQFLPGPASSEVGIAVGITRAGLLGGLAAWLGFTMPSALALIAFGYGVQHLTVADAGWIHGLLIVAVAVVAQAVWGMARQFCPDRKRQTMAVLATLVMLTWQTGLAQVLLIVAAALVGWRIIESQETDNTVPLHEPIPRRLGIAALSLFGVLLVGLPILQRIVGGYALALFTGFYRVGSLVFGGGHVVLPLLQSAVVPPGWVSETQFVAGYGAAQAVPGPLFTFAAYLGTVAGPSPHGWVGGMIALIGIFLPAFLLVVGVMPFWNAIRVRPGFQSALRGVNAAVVGLLLAALYNPVWTTAIKDRADFGLAVVAFGLLVLWKLPPWMVVVVGAVGGALIRALS
jgi:chromate transporter